MFDFTWTDHTFGNVLYCIAVFTLFIVLFYRKYVTKALVQSTKADLALIIAAFVLIITACIDGDWFHYGEMVHDYDLTPNATNYGEPVYFYIINTVNKNYLLFRIIVWGLAFWMTCMAFKRFEINPNIAVFFLIAVFLVKFNYARATLGMASYYLGLSFLLKPRKSLSHINWLLAILFLFGAYVFHHSMLVLIILTITAFLPFDKPVVIMAMAICLPLLASALKSSLNLVDMLDNEYLSEKLDKYMELDKGRSNIFGIIASFFGYGVFLIPVIMDTVAVLKNHTIVSGMIKRLFRITLSTLLFSLSFLFMGLDSNVFVYRFMFMTFIPITIVTVYLFEHHCIDKKRYSIIVLWGMFVIFFKLLTLFLDYK